MTFPVFVVLYARKQKNNMECQNISHEVSLNCTCKFFCTNSLFIIILISEIYLFILQEYGLLIKNQLIVNCDAYFNSIFTFKK